jgi:hypothetical protein
VKQIELCLKVCGVMLVLAGIAAGQEIPKIDVFGGFSYLRVHSGEVPADNALNGILPVSHRNVNFNMAEGRLRYGKPELLVWWRI